jgi:hypothetical protein
MSEGIADLVQVGANPNTRSVLEDLRDHGHIADLMDGYRLAIAAAIAFARKPRHGERGERRTMFAAGNLDPDMSLRSAIAEIYTDARTWPYRAAEDLAEQGAEILRNSMDGEEIWFDDLMRRIEEVNLGDHGEEDQTKQAEATK